MAFPTASTRRLGAAALAPLALLAAPSVARGHGLDANHVELVLHDDVVEAVATVPAAFLPDADANRDGRVSRAELRPVRETALRRLVDAVRITDGDGREGALERADVSVPRDGDDDPRGAEHVRVTVVRRFGVAPGALRLRCLFVGSRPVSVYATRATAASPGVLTFAGDPESALLPSASAEVALLAAPTPAPPAPRASARAPVSPASPPAHHAALAALAGFVALAFTAARRRNPAAPGAR